MFNLCVVPAGHDMVTDSGRATRAQANSKPYHYKQKYKNWRTFRKYGFQLENCLKISEEKIDINITLDLYETTQWKTRALNATVELGLCNQKKKLRLSWNRHWGWNCPNVCMWLPLTKSKCVQSFVVFIGHGIITDIIDAATFRPRL